MLQMMNFPANESMLTAVRCEKEFILRNTQCFDTVCWATGRASSV